MALFDACFAFKISLLLDFIESDSASDSRLSTKTFEFVYIQTLFCIRICLPRGRIIFDRQTCIVDDIGGSR